MRISDWSSDVCSSDLDQAVCDHRQQDGRRLGAAAHHLGPEAGRALLVSALGACACRFHARNHRATRPQSGCEGAEEYLKLGIGCQSLGVREFWMPIVLDEIDKRILRAVKIGK